MKHYSPKQWILIDAATQFGMDKLPYEDRLSFGRELKTLMEFIDYSDPKAIKEAFQSFIHKADEPEMFSAALLAIADGLAEKPNGYMVGLDACASGPQLLSVSTRCLQGMLTTGVIDNNGKVPNLYRSVQENMGSDIPVKQIKKATVPHVYGSTAAPRNVFGDDVGHFIAAYTKAVPMAEWAKNVLINSWDRTALVHEWRLPDGAYAHVRVVNTKEYRGKFQGFTYTYKTSINAPIVEGQGVKSLSANVTHSYDGYFVREINRRCNYDMNQVQTAIGLIRKQLDSPQGNSAKNPASELEGLWKRHNILSVAVLEHIDSKTVVSLSGEYLRQLLIILLDMVEDEPHAVRTIHDEFASAPNHVENMRYWYNQLLVETYRGTWLMDTIHDLSGTDYSHYIPPVDPRVEKLIAENQYAIN